MQIDFTFSRDANYFRAGLLPGARVKTLPYLTGGLFAIMAGGTVAALSHGTPAGIALGCALVATGVVLLILRQRRIKAMVTVPASWFTSRRWLITGGGLASSTELTRDRYAWSSFRTAHALPHAYLLFRDGMVVDVPRRPLTAEQDAELGAFLRARSLLQPQKAR